MSHLDTWHPPLPVVWGERGREREGVCVCGWGGRERGSVWVAVVGRERGSVCVCGWGGEREGEGVCVCVAGVGEREGECVCMQLCAL